MDMMPQKSLHKAFCPSIGVFKPPNSGFWVK